jgi:hypothetical protein
MVAGVVFAFAAARCSWPPSIIFFSASCPLVAFGPGAELSVDGVRSRSMRHVTGIERTRVAPHQPMRLSSPPIPISEEPRYIVVD